MGLFDGVLGGVVGAGMVAIVGDILEKHGGVQGVVNEFERKGFSDTVRSWVSTGPNQPISPDHLRDALGAQTLQQIATRAGLSVPELLQKLAQVLPQAIDKLTPDGVIPKA